MDVESIIVVAKREGFKYIASKDKGSKAAWASPSDAVTTRKAVLAACRLALAGKARAK
jgi:hypothetical protein